MRNRNIFKFNIIPIGFAFLFLLFSIESKAQKFECGAIVGVNASWIYNYTKSTNPEFKVKNSILPSPDAGIFAAYKPTNKLRLQTGVLYSMKGAFDTEYQNEKLTQDAIIMHYIEFPVLISYEFEKPYFAALGVAFDYKMDDNVTTIHFFEYDCMILANAGIRWSNFRFCIQTKFGIEPLTTILTPNNDSGIDFLQLFNQSAGFSVAYTILQSK